MWMLPTFWKRTRAVSEADLAIRGRNGGAAEVIRMLASDRRN
jgi:hypothetical protein